MFREFLKYLAVVYKILRLKWWDLRESETDGIQLEVLKNIFVEFIRKGDIVKILYSDQHLVRFQKSFEYKSLELFLGQIKKGDTILDVGANVGLYSLLGAKYIGSEGKVYAFEPTDKTYKILDLNIKRSNLSNIYSQHIALADGKRPMMMLNPTGESGEYEDAMNKITFLEQTIQDQNITYTDSLDNFVLDHALTRIDFIKIDIEGAELLFFRGANQSLRQYKPKLLFEAKEEHCQFYGYSVLDSLVYLYNLGYSIKQVDHEQWFAQ